MQGVIAGNQPEVGYHGNEYDAVTAAGDMVALRRSGSAIRLTLNPTGDVTFTAEEADTLAYNLACAVLAARIERGGEDGD